LFPSADPHSSLMIEFASKDDAIVYCERMGTLVTFISIRTKKKYLKMFRL